MILHEFALSGNCYKIRLTAAHLGIALERRAYDITHRRDAARREFLATINANGRIPVLQDGDRMLAESNAICCYLGRRQRPHPRRTASSAPTCSHWMFWEQYNHEPNIATLRFWLAFLGEERLSDAPARCRSTGKRAAGEAALALMDAHLAKTGVAGRRPLHARRHLPLCLHPRRGGGWVLHAPPTRRLPHGSRASRRCRGTSRSTDRR